MSKHKLLLADDSITIQKVVNLTFADEGIEVISVGDGNSAMEKFAEVTPDLVMADINMPGLNGYEICERIKQNDETRSIPVILLVGSFEPFDEEEAKRVGADAFLTKPFQSIRQLVTQVSDLLNSNDIGETLADGDESDAPADSFDETIEFEKVSSEQLDDNGMDDEMIQADPISDYVFDDAQKFQSPTEIDPDSDVELDEANLLELPPRENLLATFSNLSVSTGETDSADNTENEETTDVEPDETEASAASSELSPETIDAIAAKVVEKISDKVIREIVWEIVPQMTDLIVKRLAEEKLKE